jgi:hypothetical protein
MKKIASKEIFVKIIILSVIIMVSASGIPGCHADRDAIGGGLKDTVAAEQQTGSGSSSQAEPEQDKTSAGSENNSFSDSKSGSQSINGDDTATVPASGTDSDTTVDESKIQFTFVISGDNRPANEP